ncbi:hypothetical protein M413DRAFT_32245 [Hebeloma cylindrosporum]|uniref:Uncharacterized protein n=1 Tax=Hebeloma cylindrosporum TaxID=76867 RepID=A0A0C3BWL0_HEBCY|nr:hypothetical protein M413DRAFT_32245 [Hebeloma cylindrosporum h7]
MYFTVNPSHNSLQLHHLSFGGSSSTAISMIGAALRPDGRPVFNLAILPSVTLLLNTFDDFEASRKLFQHCSQLSKVDISLSFPPLSWTGIAKMLKPSIETLTHLHLKTGTQDETGTNDPLGGLVAELEEMRHQNVVEKVTINVSVLSCYQCSHGDDWGLLDVVMTQSGWPKLERVSLNIFLWLCYREHDLSATLESLPQTQFPRLSSSSGLLSALHSKAIDLSEREGRLEQFEIQQYIDKIDDISRSFKRSFNRAAAINRLPVELLTRIFEAIQVHRSSKFPLPFAKKAQHTFCDAEVANSWVPLTTHVCNSWREIAISTPYLWNYIYLHVKQKRRNSGWSYYPPPSILLGSRSVPLHVAVHVNAHVGGISVETELSDALRTIPDRAETLQIHWEGRLDAGMQNLLRHPFPHLTSLTLMLNVGGLDRLMQVAIPIPETIFGGELLQLRRLSLWFYTSWSFHKFPNLTHVSLRNQYVRPSINDFLDLLEATPSLESLLLCSAGPKIAQGTVLPQRTIFLPSLRFAQFTSNIQDERYMVRILECLKIRHLTRCSVRYTSEIGFANNIPPISPHIVDRIFSHINPEGIMELKVYQFEGYAYSLEIGVSRISMQTMPKNLVSIPAPSCRNIEHLHLLSDSAIPRVDWEGFPNLLSIICHDSLNGVDALVKSLSPSSENGSPCPLLEMIYLRAGEELPNPNDLDTSEDTEFIRDMLSRFPESPGVHRGTGNSYEVALELHPAFPEWMEVPKFPKELRVNFPYISDDE